MIINKKTLELQLKEKELITILKNLPVEITDKLFLTILSKEVTQLEKINFLLKVLS